MTPAGRRWAGTAPDGTHHASVGAGCLPRACPPDVGAWAHVAENGPLGRLDGWAPSEPVPRPTSQLRDLQALCLGRIWLNTWGSI